MAQSDWLTKVIYRGVVGRPIQSTSVNTLKMPRNTSTSSAAAAASPDDSQPSTSAGPLRFFDDSLDDESGERFVPRGRVRIESSSDSGDDSELDFVSHDTTLDSDESLSAYAQRLRERNCPGQPGFRWRKENVPKRFDFRAQPGVNTPGVDSDSSPLELFTLLFTDELIDVIVRETNRYHRQRPAPRSSHTKDWVDTSASELRVFIGLRMAMALIPKPEQRSYWSTDLFYHSPWFPVTMTRDRFDQLSRYLHMADNEESHPDDRLWKLRPVIETLQPQFTSVYTHPRRITVDIPASQRAVIHLMGATGLFEKGAGARTRLAQYVPTDLQAKASGDMDSRSTPTGMLCMQWRDRREVTLLSTIHKSEMVATRSRRGFERIKPQVVTDYNYGMNGVDTIVNAFSLHKVLGGRLTQLIFRKKLAEDLMQLGSRHGREVRSRSISRSSPPAPVLQGIHCQISTPHGRYRRCRLYYTRGMRRMTKMMCSGCDVPLCWTSCFEEYHTLNASTSR
ncbi:piggyBac transposable element-derived protein 4-like [Penaeus vannamei]|uniref:piggyBac transposable element-derived protein 4-like n=1 Tax=Penaeus vannamei TaxID=6689 RepID=UPI00387F813B